MVLLALIGLWALLWFPPSANWLAARALSAPVAAGSLRAEVGSARLWRLGSLRLVDVRFIREDGSLLASVDSVVGTYRGTPLLRRRIIIPALRLVDPTIDVRKVDGVWEVASLTRSAGAEDSEIASQPSPWTIEMGRFAVHRGAAVVSSNGHETGRVEDLVLRGSDLVVGEDGSVSIDTLSFRATSPGAPGSLEAVLRGAIEDRTLRLDTLSLASPSSRASAKGSVPWPASDLFSMRRPPVIALDVDAPHVMLGDLGFLGANLNPAGAFSANATVGNPAPGQTEASARVTFGDGSSVEMIALLEERERPRSGETSSLSLTGTLDVEDLNPSYLVVDSPSGNVHASGEADIQLIPRSDSLGSTVASGEVSAELRPSTLGALAAEQGRLDLALEASEITIDYRGSFGSTVQDLRADVEAHGVLIRGSRPGYTGQARMVVGGLAPEPLTLLVEAEGRGFDPDSITGDLTVDLPQQTAFDRPLEARLTYSPETSSGPWSVELDHGGGSLDGEGHLGLGGHPMWTISRLVADSLDLGAWARDSLPSHLSGQADGRLQGLPGPTLNGTMELELTTWTLRGRPLPPTSGSIELDDGMVRLRAETGGSGPRVSVNASATPFETPPAVTIHRAEFAGLNPAAFGRDSTLTGSVNGSLSGGLQGNDLATASGNLELRLDSSRIAAQDITFGTGNFGLSEGLLGGRVSLEYPGGEATVDAQAHFSGAGWTDLEISKATFRGVDLGRFTAGGELTTDLVGEMEGSLTRDPGGRPSGEASLRLAPSTVNAGEIESGSLAAQLTEGRIAAGGTFYVDGGGSVDLTVAAAVDSSRFSVERAQADFHLPELGALLGAESPASLQGRVELASSGSNDGGWTFQGSAWNGGWDNLTLDTMAISGRLGSNVVDVDTILARGNAFSAHGGGLIPLDATETEPPTFTLTAELTDALPLAPLIDAEVLEVGTATAEIRLGRRADAVVLEGHLDANAILVDELRIVGLAGDWFLAGAGANR
ncbi:MAG: hypothetical protein HKN73_07775, partial [Gemmatimonadetes bacterium]|nr:hypothetical protein [Gemmatimonadota bacterium]